MKTRMIFGLILSVGMTGFVRADDITPTSTARPAIKAAQNSTTIGDTPSEKEAKNNLLKAQQALQDAKLKYGKGSPQVEEARKNVREARKEIKDAAENAKKK